MAEVKGGKKQQVPRSWSRRANGTHNNKKNSERAATGQRAVEDQPGATKRGGMAGVSGERRGLRGGPGAVSAKLWTRLTWTERQKKHIFSGVVMTRQITKPAGAVRPVRQSTTHSVGVSYQRHIAAPRALFAVAPVDLTTLVIAEAIKRRAQAEIQREALRDSVYEMPVSQERNYERGADIHPSDADD